MPFFRVVVYPMFPSGWKQATHFGGCSRNGDVAVFPGRAKWAHGTYRLVSLLTTSACVIWLSWLLLGHSVGLPTLLFLTT